MQGAKVFCFNLPAEQLRRLSICAEKAGAAAVEVPQADFSQTVGALLGVLPRKNEVCLAPFSQPMIIMSTFENTKMDLFLKELKAEQVRITYKAVVTPTNLMWRCDALLAELVKEHEQIKRVGERK